MSSSTTPTTTAVAQEVELVNTREVSHDEAADWFISIFAEEQPEVMDNVDGKDFGRPITKPGIFKAFAEKETPNEKYGPCVGFHAVLTNKNKSGTSTAIDDAAHCEIRLGRIHRYKDGMTRLGCLVHVYTASAAVKAAVSHAFTTLQVEEVVFILADQNKAGQAFYKRLGFAPTDYTTIKGGDISMTLWAITKEKFVSFQNSPPPVAEQVSQSEAADWLISVFQEEQEEVIDNVDGKGFGRPITKEGIDKFMSGPLETDIGKYENTISFLVKDPATDRPGAHCGIRPGRVKNYKEEVKVGYIIIVYTAPTYRKKGFASGAVRAAVTHAFTKLDDEIQEVVFILADRNAIGQAFYQRLGFGPTNHKVIKAGIPMTLWSIAKENFSTTTTTTT